MREQREIKLRNRAESIFKYVEYKRESFERASVGWLIATPPIVDNVLSLEGKIR